MSCSNCGKQIQDGARFCANCGTPIGGDGGGDVPRPPIAPDFSSVQGPEPPQAPPEKAQWSTPLANGPNQWRAQVELHSRYPDTRDNLMSADTDGVECLKCGHVNPLGYCSNCNGSVYRYGFTTEGVVGVFCRQCRIGRAFIKCTACGCENPISNTTMAKKFTAKSGGCVVVTAACGDRFAPEVLYLLGFRDSVLAPTSCGRWFVSKYYRIAPPIARVIGTHRLLRVIVRHALVRPVVLLLKITTSKANALNRVLWSKGKV